MVFNNCKPAALVRLFPGTNCSVIENKTLTSSKTAYLGCDFLFELLDDPLHNISVLVLAQGIHVLIQKRDVRQVPDELISMQTSY